MWLRKTYAKGVWKEFVAYEGLSADVEEWLCETTYFSYFVRNLAGEKERLTNLVCRVMADIAANVHVS